jgi:hypothetical protein
MTTHITDNERKLQTQVNLLTTTNEVLAARLSAAETDYEIELAVLQLTVGNLMAERDVKSDIYITALEELVKRTAERDAQSKAADHWMTEACAEHNNCVRLEAERNALANAPNNDLPVALLERLAATLSRLGKATPEGGIERFNADIEYQLYSLCRGVDSVISGSDALAERVKALEAAQKESLLAMQAGLNVLANEGVTYWSDVQESLSQAIKGATT